MPASGIRAHLHKWKKNGKKYQVQVGKDIVTYQPEICKFPKCGYKRNRVVKSKRSRLREIFGAEAGKNVGNWW